MSALGHMVLLCMISTQQSSSDKPLSPALFVIRFCSSHSIKSTQNYRLPFLAELIEDTPALVLSESSCLSLLESQGALGWI